MIPNTSLFTSTERLQRLTTTRAQTGERDSKFRGWLQQALPEHDVEGEACIFHWTGENLEADRNTAANDLLKLIKEFEDTKTPYHLIGHSHGGSVISELLKQSMRAPRHQLASLRSWTTVGSPFLQHYSSVPPPIRRIAQWALNPLLWFSLLVNVFYLVPLVRAAFAREVPGWEIAIGWGVSAAACAIFALLLQYFNSATRVGMDRVIVDEAARRYGRTWLGLWTTDDEAINGLKATTKLKPGHQVELVPRMSLKRSHYVGWIWKSFSLPLTIPASLIFNHLVRKWLNKRLVRTLMKFAQGDDRPGSYVDHVSARSSCPTTVGPCGRVSRASGWNWSDAVRAGTGRRGPRTARYSPTTGGPGGSCP